MFGKFFAKTPARQWKIIQYVGQDMTWHRTQLLRGFWNRPPDSNFGEMFGGWPLGAYVGSWGGNGHHRYIKLRWEFL